MPAFLHALEPQYRVEITRLRAIINHYSTLFIPQILACVDLRENQSFLKVNLFELYTANFFKCQIVMQGPFITDRFLDYKGL